MKSYRKIFLFTVLFIFFASDIYAQIHADSIKVKNSSCFEVFMNDTPTKEKMSLEKSWISQNFGDYKSVLQYEDEIKNTIVIKGRLELYASDLEMKIKKLSKMMGQASDKRHMYFTIEFSNKDDRYRVKISDITIKTFSVSLGGWNAESNYEQWTDQGVEKANLNLKKLQKEVDSLKSVSTAGLSNSDIKKLNKEIEDCEKDLAKAKEKLENKTKKSNTEKRWLNSNLASIFNSIYNHMQKSSDDDF